MCKLPTRIVSWVRCGIGLYGRAIVIWCNGVFTRDTKRAHCTVCWREKAFTDKEKNTVIDLRKRWLQDRGLNGMGCEARLFNRTSAGGVVYELHDCELKEFVSFVRASVKPEWSKDIAMPTPHITVLPPQ